MKKHIKKIIIGAIIIIILGISFFMNKEDNLRIDIPNIINDKPDKSKIIVEIKGEVNVPGIYILDEDARVFDLIYLAGGLTINANTDNINLVSKLADGMVIYVNKKEGNKQSNKISINTASISELMSLSGIGEARARNIITYRNEKGPFNSIEEIKNVSGISETIFEQIKDHICV